MILGSKLAWMLGTPRVDLINQCLSSKREYEAKRASSVARASEASVWADEGQRLSEAFGRLIDNEGSSPHDILADFGLPVNQYSISAHTQMCHFPGVIEIDVGWKGRIFGSSAETGDDLYRLGDTDIVLVFKPDLFGGLLAYFARRTGPNELREFQPRVPEGRSEEVRGAKEVVLGMLKTTSRNTNAKLDYHLSLEDAKALVGCKPELEVVLAVLEELRVSHDVCFVTTMMLCALWQRWLQPLPRTGDWQ
jgi:hypothetical protein